MNRTTVQLAALLFLTGTASIAIADAPSHLPIQGLLFDNQDNPIDGTYDIQFSLYVTDTSSSPVFRETLTDVPLENGYFSVYLQNNAVTAAELDLSLFQLNGTLYLGIKVESDNEMTPRLQLGTAAYAAYSQYASTATSLEGLSASDVALLNHSHGLQDLPAELATDNDTRPTAACDGNHVLTWNGSAFSCVADKVPSCTSGVLTWTGSDYACIATPLSSCGQLLAWNGTEFVCAADNNTTYSAASAGGLALNGTEFSIATGGVTDGHISGTISSSKIESSGLNADTLDGLEAADLQLKRTVVVSPVGTASANGAALLAAMAGITDASATNPYLLKIEPGIYDLGSTRLEAKNYVDIEGSGEKVTLLTSLVSGGSEPVQGALLAANASIRSLSIENSGTGTWVVGIFLKTATATLQNITLTSNAPAGQRSVCVKLASQSTAEMKNVTCTATGGDRAYGIYNENSSYNLKSCSIVATGGTTSSEATRSSNPGGTKIRIAHSHLESTNSPVAYNNADGVDTKLLFTKCFGQSITTPRASCSAVVDESGAFFPDTCP